MSFIMEQAIIIQSIENIEQCLVVFIKFIIVD